MNFLFVCFLLKKKRFVDTIEGLLRFLLFEIESRALWRDKIKQQIFVTLNNSFKGTITTPHHKAHQNLKYFCQCNGYHKADIVDMDVVDQS